MFEEMAKAPAAWLSGQGEEATVVLSTRVRLARNVAGCKFPSAADSDTKKRVVSYFDSAMTRSRLLSEGQYVKASDISELDRDFLIERHLISPAFLTGDASKALFIGQTEQVSIMVNEEDHLRVQALAAGFDPQAAYDQAMKYDGEIGKYLEFDYDPDFGYMTACPTNAGTGMRASVLIHLPGLVLTRDIEKVISKITRSGLMVRGFYGEGSDVLGNLFQVANQNTLGISESEILGQINRVTREIIEAEASARQRLMDEAADMVEDKIWRAYGILKYAYVLTSEEVMNLLSAVRLGHALKIIDFLNIALINEMLLLSQPAHLQKFYGQEMDVNRRDFVRAQMVREKLRNSD
ncbi:protein arginine kinase [candidate division GN15 bacterium]|uniref:Protein arginine kinase n=1 Tax=candidate division GN15 bacterium TaxID=2072418 RepID=A0A855X8X3_9BACT|nr:MAG: protein arginine kinase [candidate division GN15 bacterium]